jgi:hypothetical protein
VLDEFNDDVSDCVEGYIGGWASSRKLLAAEVDLRSRGYDVEIGEGQDLSGSPKKCLLIRLRNGLKRT